MLGKRKTEKERTGDVTQSAAPGEEQLVSVCVNVCMCVNVFVKVCVYVCVRVFQQRNVKMVRVS